MAVRITLVMVEGQYEDDLVGNSLWASGDWNGDGEFDTGDIILAFQDGGYEKGRRSPVPWTEPASVPEPAGTTLLLTAALLVCALKRHVLRWKWSSPMRPKQYSASESDGRVSHE